MLLRIFDTLIEPIYRYRGPIYVYVLIRYEKHDIEYIKYAPKELQREIARILNDTTELMEDLLELVTRILTPLQRPQK